MAYKFGQFRKEQYSNYINSLNGILSIGTTTSFSVDFHDIVLAKDQGDFTTSDGSLFLRFSVKKFSRETGVTIKLINEDSSALSTTNVQTVATIIVPAAESEEDNNLVTYDIVITPNETYKKLIFAINRDSYDFQTPREWTTSDTSFKIEKFGIITNIITILGSNDDPVVRLKQIGVQSYPGLEMCINGEMVRVGRSGIYEINYGIDVTFIGFMPRDDNTNDGLIRNHFILDYQY